MIKQDQGKTSLGLGANLAALLGYALGFVSGIILYALEKENKFVRFHAKQSILVFASLFLLSIIVNFLPVIGPVFSFLLGVISMILWITLMIKAYQGEYFKIPFAGEIAGKNL